MNLKLFNTLTKTKEDFNPINHKSIKMYACGPTLYNNPHIGNFRPIIVFDINTPDNLYKVVKGENIGTRVNL